MPVGSNKYHAAEIQGVLSAEMLQTSSTDVSISQLLLDSRQISEPSESLFFALPGKRHDGHAHLREAWEKGVRQFVVSRHIDVDILPDANIFKVKNTLDALQQLVAWHRAHFTIPVVGITGSNGKTIVKEWLLRLLSPDFQVVYSPKSYNSQVGVPLSVWQMQSQHTLAIFEAGISQLGEMARLEPMIRPKIGILTNIGPAHSEGFVSDEQKLAEKMRLFDHTEVLIGCADQALVWAAAQTWQKAQAQRQLFFWSRQDADSTVQVQENPTSNPSKSVFQVKYATPNGLSHVEIVLPFSDAASIENALHCLCLMLYLGVPGEVAAERLLRLEPLGMRLELKAGIHHSTIVNDAYSNDLASLRIALQFARQQARNQRLTLILSDVFQSGLSRELLCKNIAALLREHHVTRFFGIGSDIPWIKTYLNASIEAAFFPDTAAFLATVSGLDFQQEVILVKGARDFAFERIVQRLEQKAHKTVLEVNLSALVHNLNVYNRLLQSGTRMMAMVKAAGYGSGSAEVAKLLEFHKVDYLGVAYADEGIELRQAGVQLRILVLNPEVSSLDAMYRYRLEPEVYSHTMLDELIRYSGTEKQINIHLKLDTGMHRLGFEEADIPALLERLEAHPNLRVQSVFSHLSASDNPLHDNFTHQQAAIFAKCCTAISTGLGYMPLRHLCNSGAIGRFPEYHFDMVRLGIGLYGIDAGPLQAQLRVVNTLKATISQIKSVPAGDTVGYNRNSGLLAAPRRIATISIGYADGFLRLAGGGRYAVGLRGQKAYTIGNVCMDMTMIDISHIPDAQEGDEVIVLGEQVPVQDLASALHTIPYEVFTNISERVKRVYWQE
jgi:Alr-MurF fusion protein